MKKDHKIRMSGRLVTFFQDEDGGWHWSDGKKGEGPFDTKGEAFFSAVKILKRKLSPIHNLELLLLKGG